MKLYPKFQSILNHLSIRGLSSSSILHWHSRCSQPINPVLHKSHQKKRDERERRERIEREEREECLERDTGWVRVTSRAKRDVRNRVSLRNKPHERYTETRGRVRQSAVVTNWRDHPDISSFYFKRFTDEITEKDLWQHFKRWGDVREIFIPNRRNYNGRRYGFVRFKGVNDVQQLARKLDNSVIGGLKLFVNVPKYTRARRTYENRGRQIETDRGDMTIRDQRNRQQPQRLTLSYADVVREKNDNQPPKHEQPQPSSWHEISTSSVLLSVKKEETQWLEDAWVGRLANPAKFEVLEEELRWELGLDLTPRYLGDDLVLLTGVNEAVAAQLMNGGPNGSLVYSLEKWKPNLRTGNRMVWIQCWGIPLQVWGRNHIWQIVGTMGDMVDVDDDVETKRRVDRARVLIRTPWPPTITHIIDVHVADDTFKAYVAEECGSTTCEHHSKRSYYGDTSDEQESNGSCTGDEFVEDTCLEGTNCEITRAAPSNHRPNTPQSLVDVGDTTVTATRAAPLNHRPNTPQGIVGAGDTTVTALSNGWKRTEDPMDKDDVLRIKTTLNSKPTFDANLEVHAANLPCMETHLNGQPRQPNAILESGQKEKGESSGTSVIHESGKREKGESSDVKCQPAPRAFECEGNPNKGKQIMEVKKKGLYDKGNSFEQQSTHLQCGPQLGQPTELLNEPHTYLAHTPSKKAMEGNWRVYSRGSWSNRRSQTRGSLEGRHMPLNIIRHSNKRNNYKSETGDINSDQEQEASRDINSDQEQEASGGSIQTQEAIKMWKLIQQLGVNTGNNQDAHHREILQKLSSMETRDRLEVERLGDNARDP